MDLADTVQLLEAIHLMPDGDVITLTKFEGIVDWQQTQPAVVKPKPWTKSTPTKSTGKKLLTPIQEGTGSTRTTKSKKKKEEKSSTKYHKYELSSSSDDDTNSARLLSSSSDDEKLKRKTTRTAKNQKKTTVKIDLGESSDDGEYVVDNDFSQQAACHGLIRHG